MPDSAPPPIGHNQPPADAELLLTRLQNDHAALVSRRDKLLEGVKRAPTEINDEETAGKMADFVEKQLKAFVSAADDVHDTEKAPFLAAGRVVDGFWHSLKDEIDASIKRLNVIRKRYADKKDQEARRKLEEEARQRQAEADRQRREAEAAAAKARSEKAREAAEQKAAAAEQAQAVADQASTAAQVAPSVLGRSVGAGGGTTILKREWTYENLDRATLDLEALRPHLSNEVMEKAVRDWIKAHKNDLEAGKAPELKGVRVFKGTKL